jgi:3'-5' exoribonuclease
VKNIFVDELQDGDELVNEPFLIEDVVKRETKDGRPYLLSSFRDKSGQIGGVFWNVPDDVESWVRSGMVALVTGRVQNYRNSLQITATDLNPQLDPDMSLFLPASQRAIDEMVAEYKAAVGELSQPWQGIISKVLLESDIFEIFIRAPAARMMHHAYVGGLLEHTLSMVGIARFLIDRYPYVNKDLLLAGVLLHDMGKALEYDTEAAFNFTEDGRLVGHVVRAAIMVENAASDLRDIDKSELRELIHLILSHHGHQEWGSPVEPKTIEAVLLQTAGSRVLSTM